MVGGYWGPCAVPEVSQNTQRMGLLRRHGT